MTTRAEQNGNFLVEPIPSGKPLHDMSAQFIAAVYGAAMTGELFGLPLEGGFTTNPQGRLVSEPELATTAMVSILAEAYLAGRKDQISDMEDNSDPRTVRVRQLPEIIAFANAFRPMEDQVEVAGVLELFTQYRGSLKNVGIDLSGLSDAEKAEITDLVAEDRIRIGAFNNRTVRMILAQDTQVDETTELAEKNVDPTQVQEYPKEGEE